MKTQTITKDNIIEAYSDYILIHSSVQKVFTNLLKI